MKAENPKPTIFTQIINGEIPSHKIYEDEKTFAFLDIHPKTPGHVLVVPKSPVPFVWDLSDGDYQAVMTTVKKVANQIKQVLGYDLVGEEVIGVDVPHAHVHVFGFNSMEEFRRIVDLTAKPDHAALAELAKKLAIEED